jgi:hypothetical protein
MTVDNHFTRQYNPEDSSEHHTRRRENLKSHTAERLSASQEGLCSMELVELDKEPC